MSYRVSAIEHGAGYWVLLLAIPIVRRMRDLFVLALTPAAVSNMSPYVFRSVQSQPGGGGEKPDRAVARTIFTLKSCGATQTRPYLVYLQL